MKCTLCANPVFWIDITPRQVALLEDLSKKHYDAKCRQAGMVGGFLYGWNNIRWFEVEQKVPEFIRLMASFSDLDTCLKIMEIAYSVDRSVQKEIDEIILAFKTFLKASNDLIPKFEHEFES